MADAAQFYAEYEKLEEKGKVYSLSKIFSESEIALLIVISICLEIKSDIR